MAFTSEDDLFFHLLGEGGELNRPMTLTNPALVRAQGLLACQRKDDGMDTFVAVVMLAAEGPYSWDTASTRHATALVAYCPQLD